jgi:zinc transport system permease protein
VGATAPLIGAFLVQKRLSLLGDGMGHLAFAGVAAGLLLGVWPVPIALAVASLGAVAVERMRRRGRTSGDLALALVFYSGIAAGVVLAGRAGSFNASILGYLFGSVLTVSTADAMTVVVLGLAVLVVMAVMGRVLFAVVLDEESARVAGLPVDGVNTLLAVLAAVTVVAAMRVVGVLLVAAMMVLPVAAAQLVARSFRLAVTTAMAIGMASVVVGLAVARQWGLPPGGTIVLVTAAVYVVLNVIGLQRQAPHRPSTAK